MRGAASGTLRLARHGLAWAQGIAGLFGAGAVLVQAHRLFLRYYAREWAGLQFTGVNDCSQVDAVANADLFDSAQTFCNKPINYVPWFEIYRRHWQAACAYYGAALALILIAGLVIYLLQRRLGRRSPFGTAARVGDPAVSEHLR